MASTSGGAVQSPFSLTVFLNDDQSKLEETTYASAVSLCAQHNMLEPTWFDKDFSFIDGMVCTAPTFQQQQAANLAFNKTNWPAGITCPLTFSVTDLES